MARVYSVGEVKTLLTWLDSVLVSICCITNNPRILNEYFLLTFRYVSWLEVRFRFSHSGVQARWAVARYDGRCRECPEE